MEETNQRRSPKFHGPRRLRLRDGYRFSARSAVGVCVCCLAEACHSVVDSFLRMINVCDSVHYDI